MKKQKDHSHNSSVYIIAEAGVNHNGNLELARRMVDEAVISGADAIKFQTFQTEKLVCLTAPKAEYQLQITGAEESQFNMLKKLELSNRSFQELNAYCQAKGIQFISTPFDHESVDFLYDLGVPFFKVSSSDITNLPLLRKIGLCGKPVMISTGMSTLGETEAAIAVLTESGLTIEQLTILHCNTEYPTPFRDVNLEAIQTIKTSFPGAEVGYSDHTLGIEVPIAAVAMGATVIEKHFTLDKKMKGPDHQASLDPSELKAMVSAIRNIESAIGDGRKLPSLSERANILTARRSIVASINIKRGEIFSEQNLSVKRPGTGICPMQWFEVIGKKAMRDFAQDELIELF